MFLLALLCIAGPFLFGLPLAGWQSAVDSNFALSLTRGSMHALSAGVWLPRWLPEANSGLGSPVFYFYGRLPFLVAAACGLLLHLSAAGALIAAFLVFRAASFFTCRIWLSRHVEARAADCGALTFLAFPFAMIFNPLTRVALAETAATAVFPLILLAIDQSSPARTPAARRTQALAVAGLGIGYAALAWMHPLHLLLGFAVTLLYAALARGLAGAIVNALGFLLGMLLGAASFLPAVAMLPLISPSGWTTGIPGLLLSNNFLFSAARYRVYRIHDIDLLLYSTWLICAVILLQAARRARLRPAPGLGMLPAGPRPLARALMLTLLVCLAAMTVIARPLWFLLQRLQLIQFPWRLFPCALAFAAALVALYLTRTPRAQRLCTRLLLALIVVQLALPAAGAYLSFSGIQRHRKLSDSLLHRVPAYTSLALRNQPPNTLENSVEPEYIPYTALRAGWVVGPWKAYMLPGLPAFHITPNPAPGLHFASNADGSFTVQGTLAQPQSVILPVFYFPDEQIAGQIAERSSGAPQTTLTLDTRTGLARLQLPAGAVDITLDHGRPLRTIAIAHALTLLGVCILAVTLVFGLPLRSIVRRLSTPKLRSTSVATEV